MADENTEMTDAETDETPEAEAETPEPEAEAETPEPEAEAETPAAEAEAETPEPEAETPEPEDEAETPESEDAPAEETAEGAEEAAAGAEDPGAEAAREEAPATDAVAPAPQPKKRKRVPRPERRQRAKPARGTTEGRKPITRLDKPEHERGRSQERRGIVVSSEMDKTIVVRVETLKAHRRYKKIIRRSTKLHAHDERNEAKVGDTVRIVETRPLSKTKRWRLAEIVEEAK